jgi:hypothetical protein
VPSSVDLTIGSHDPQKADAFADTICHHSNLGLMDKTWKIPVLFADGTLANECRMTGLKQRGKKYEETYFCGPARDHDRCSGLCKGPRT